MFYTSNSDRIRHKLFDQVWNSVVLYLRASEVYNTVMMGLYFIKQYSCSDFNVINSDENPIQK